MKTIKCLMVAATLAMSSFSLATGAEEPSLGEAEQVKCYCTTFGNCKASGHGSLCAQSPEGGNVNCRDYDGNC